MTIGGWIGFSLCTIVVISFCVLLYGVFEKASTKLLCILIGAVIIAGSLFGLLWYFNNTASGQRALIDQRSDIGGGIERTVTVYTADGTVLAQYQGKIDLADNDGGYIKFDFDGKRYIYYNCFVESIADIGGN